MLITITIGCMLLILYHHIGYPLLLKYLTQSQTPKERPLSASDANTMIDDDSALPSIALVIPAFNEQQYIADKIRNLAILDYPPNRLKVIIACDGCTDNTAAIARQTSQERSCRELDIEIIEYRRNSGKVAVINRVLPRLSAKIIAMSDVSALISIDALKHANRAFADKAVGLVTGHYLLANPGSDGEQSYWQYQSKLKQREAKLSSIIGAHGAFYLIRRQLLLPLPENTINDDFVIAMAVIEQGYRAIYVSSINAVELEQASNTLDLQRRKRIAAGNLQQLIRFRSLLSPKYRGVAFSFASGKALRVFMPLILIGAWLGCLLLAKGNLFFALTAVLQSCLYGSAIAYSLVKPRAPNKHLQTIYYIVAGYAANLVGCIEYICGGKCFGQGNITGRAYTIDPRIKFFKRLIDVIVATALLIVCSPLMLLIAIIIRVNSLGPVFFSQQRIGLSTPRYVKFFSMFKFRTMIDHAEASSGAILATANDTRVTPFGAFLRKTRLDELPQLVNVLRGEMSLIGPRPERPEFYQRLDDEIPFYAERTFLIQPGITGLAQINQGYDTCLEDVRVKLGYDHSYALSLFSPLQWLRMDCYIMIKTLVVMVSGRGI